MSDLAGEIERLRHAVALHYAQHADDLCWLDDNELYAAFGLPPRDNRVGDSVAMLENCKRFIAKRCQAGGPWKSYQELEEENRQLRIVMAAAASRIHAQSELLAKRAEAKP